MTCRNRQSQSQIATLDSRRYRSPFSQEEGTVAAERLSMRKIKEVLLLKFELGLANRQIARSFR